jgi:hypothetical protein
MADGVRHVEVFNASQAKHLNVSRVIWTTIEAGPRPWDDLPAIAEAYNGAGMWVGLHLSKHKASLQIDEATTPESYSEPTQVSISP